MAKKKRQRISYVLPLASTPGGHRLGINGLSFDGDRDILYTGGRDGVICAWDLNLQAQYSEQQDRSLPPKRNTASFRRQVQAHTHWVNDIVLVKNNLAVVSASSDASIKLWRPHSQDTVTTYPIGTHSDYVKCLTTPDRNSNWVASGGLDHRIRLWDLAGQGQIQEIDVKKADNVVKGSIYTLKARGNVIASGGPEGVCRLWDTNSGRSITKLVGHTDMIRDILMSDDGDTVLTASSDQTIKVWSVVAGRCLHTLTMHNDSVWCLYSDDPTLSVFYSGDKSGLVQKTDLRGAHDVDDGLSVAVCQEHDGIWRLSIAGDSIWTATSSSSLNRWLDVDTTLEVESPPPSPKLDRQQSAVFKAISPSSSPPLPVDTESHGGTTDLKHIPYAALLRLSNTARYPIRRQERSYSVVNLRRASEAVMGNDIAFITPIRGHSEETIEGQNGLTKHVMLNDKKRVLTIDTAGEVVLWDLLKCIPIKSFGRKHLDEILPQINTNESVANWCTVDTKTGKLTVMLEENYAFDAEVYADEVEIDEQLDFREDQRINLGKWVLKNLFFALLDEEIKRDDTFRQALKSATSSQGGIQRLGAPTSIVLPASQQTTPLVSPRALLTPRAVNGGLPYTPGLHIGLATPGGQPSIKPHSPMSPGALSPLLEGDSATDTRLALQSPGNSKQEHSNDYFSAGNGSSQPAQASTTAEGDPNSLSDASPSLVATSPTEEKKKGSLFGKKFPMTFPKLGRVTTEVGKPATTQVEDKAEDTDTSSEKESEPSKVFEDNFLGVIQKIRQRYQEHLRTETDQSLPVGITPSAPTDTPVLKPPPHTLVIIQEDDPESGGLTDLYRGEISELGKEADTLERIAPAWLGDLLLKNEIPAKETVKVSFVLHPYEDLLPSLTSPNDGNSRLNANRMLRAKKIVAYICERIEAPAVVPAPASADQPTSQPTGFPASGGDAKAEAGTTKPDITDALPATPTTAAGAVAAGSSSDTTPLRPEEYLDLLCQGQKVDPNMTLATLRVHVWRTGGDIVMYYKANGKKEIKVPHPVDVAGRDEGMGTQVSSV